MCDDRRKRMGLISPSCAVIGSERPRPSEAPSESTMMSCGIFFSSPCLTLGDQTTPELFIISIDEVS